VTISALILYGKKNQINTDASLRSRMTKKWIATPEVADQVRNDDAMTEWGVASAYRNNGREK